MKSNVGKVIFNIYIQYKSIKYILKLNFFAYVKIK